MQGINKYLSLACCFSLIISNTSFAKIKSLSKKAPPPLECLGGDIETHGHALVLSPNLGRPISKKERKQLTLLAQEDPVQLLQISQLFKDQAKRQIVDLRIDPSSTEGGFSSLKHFISSNKFTDQVSLRVTALVDKTDKKGISDTEKILKDLNNVDLRTLKKKIVSKWQASADDDDETLYFQLEMEGKTILTAIQLHDGTQDCLALDLQSHRPVLPAGVDPKIIPANYMFNLPVAPPFEIGYFFGPRVFNSLNKSLYLEKNQPDEPMALVRHSKKPLEYLNKYWQFHSGIDFSVLGGTPVYAPYDGLVFAMGPMGCAGNTMVLAHTLSGTGDLIFSVYEHLMGTVGYGKVVLAHDKVLRAYRPGEKLKKGEHTRPLQIGDPVFQGAFIAKSGNSGTKMGFTNGFKEGCVDGAHLHFELRVPKDDTTEEVAKELTLPPRSKHYDVGRRFRFVEFETTPINPADFIYGVDAACQSRKNLEIENAVSLKSIDKRGVPPITAGLCSLKFESALKNVPTIYKLTRRKNELEGQTQVARRPSSSYKH